MEDHSLYMEEHFIECEFCMMEVDLYRRIPLPVEEEDIQVPLIPRALLALAKSVLGRGSSDDPSLMSLFGEDGELELRQPCGAF